MKIKVLKKQLRNGRDRIILEFTPGKDPLEQKVMRSIASANFGEKVFIRNKPLIELAFNTKQTFKRKQSTYVSELDRPEYLATKDFSLEVDDKEYKQALATMKAQAIARSLGLKLGALPLYKFHCRCGWYDTNPGEFLNHRKVCPLLHSAKVQNILLRNAEREEKDKVIELPKEKKKKITFDCRCSHQFPSKRMLTNHQKLCSILKDNDTLFERCKDYLARNKDESKIRKSRSSKKQFPVADAVSRRKRRGVSPTKRIRKKISIRT